MDIGADALRRLGCRAIAVASDHVYVRSDIEQLAALVSLVDSGDLRLEVTRRIPLAELPALHAEAAEGPVAGKVIVAP